MDTARDDSPCSGKCPGRDAKNERWWAGGREGEGKEDKKRRGHGREKDGEAARLEARARNHSDDVRRNVDGKRHP